MKRVQVRYFPRDLDERWYVNDLMHAVAGGFSDDSGTMLTYPGQIGEVDLTWFLEDGYDALDLAVRLSEFKPIARRLRVTVEEVKS